MFVLTVASEMLLSVIIIFMNKICSVYTFVSVCSCRVMMMALHGWHVLNELIGWRVLESACHRGI